MHGNTGLRGRSQRTVTLGVQAVIHDSDRRVLLVRHGYRPGWHFPGGGVERGETAETALARELLEETGVVADSRPRLFAVYAHFHEYPGDHIALYIVDTWRRPVVPPPNHEIAEHGFFDLERLPAGLAAATARRIAEVFEGLAFARSW
jgi:8-oxo-dGTP pyrophosphatase MutT (NUDIX family)